MDPNTLAALAAVATIFSALVVAVQSWYTRKSVAVSIQALQENQRTRLDANLPRFFITTDSSQPSNVYLTGGNGWGVSKRLGREDSIRLPKSATDEIGFFQVFSIHNDGPGTLMLDCNRRVGTGNPDEGDWAPSPILLTPGQAMNAVVDVTELVSTWTQGSSQEEAAEQPSIIFSYKGGGDQDVDVQVAFLVIGSPLEPIEDEYGGWRLGKYWAVEVRSLPLKRTYWRSRIKAQLL